MAGAENVMEGRRAFSVSSADGSESEVKVVIKVPHVLQTYSWDCGLACASMVLKHFGKDTHNVYTKDLEDLQCGESIWTIDLAHLLHRYEIPNKLCTITLGVDKDYVKESFYSKRFSTDQDRVTRLFENASQQGIKVEQRSVSRDEILDHIHSGNILVFLVDWAHLECIWCDRLRCQARSCFACCMRGSSCGGYQGHYVVVCGYDKKKKRIFYKNPSYDQDLCCSRMDKFDLARKSYGTDEDVLFIYKDGVS